MMLGPSYDDNYISRKMNSYQSAPTFSPPTASYGGYMQDDGYTDMDDDVKVLPSEDAYETSESVATPLVRPGYVPSARTQLILNRVALSQPRGYSPAPPRLPPRMGPPPPAYYDYDYGYGGGYGGYGGYGGGGYGGYRSPYGGGYGYGGYAPPPPPPPRYRNYDPYSTDDDYDLSYVPRYRPARLSDTLVDLEKEKLRRSLSPPTRVPTTTRTSATTTTSTTLPPSDFMAKHYSPGMLQDQVDKMRTRLQAMAFSLDPSGPVPEIVIPERSRRVDSGKDFSKKYSSGPKHLACVDFAGSTPQWKRRAMARYPSEDPNKLSELSRVEINDAEESAEKDPEKLVLKDRLSMKIHNYFSDALTPDRFQNYLRSYRTPGQNLHSSQVRCCALPNYTSKYSSAKKSDGASTSKWEEPDTVYSSLKERKPFGKPSEGDDDDLKKERRKKKKSKERDDPLAAIESSSAAAAVTESSSAADASAVSAPAAESSDAPAAADAEPEAEMDEKEKKRLEKKKRKAEREAAAKAAMEAELAALAEAELELARLEAESSNLKSAAEPQAEAAKDESAAPEAKDSEKPTEKCESPLEAPCDVLPECPPTQFECEPSLFPSSDGVAVEEPLQGEDPKEHPEFAQDLSAEPAPEAEPAPQVIETQDQPQVTEGNKMDPSEVDISADDAEPQVEDGVRKTFLPMFKSEVYLCDESEAGTTDATTLAVSGGDGDFNQQIGTGVAEIEPTFEEHQEQQQPDVQDQLEQEQEQGTPLAPDEEQTAAFSAPPEEPAMEESVLPEGQTTEHSEQPEQEPESSELAEELAATEPEQAFDTDVDIFAGRDE